MSRSPGTTRRLIALGAVAGMFLLAECLPQQTWAGVVVDAQAIDAFVPVTGEGCSVPAQVPERVEVPSWGAFPQSGMSTPPTAVPRETSGSAAGLNSMLAVEGSTVSFTVAEFERVLAAQASPDGILRPPRILQ